MKKKIRGVWVKTNQRKYRLTKLLWRTKKFAPMSFYAKSLSVSTRTITNDLDDLEEMFNEYDLKLQRRPSVGVFLTGKDADYERLLNSFPNVSQEKFERWAEILSLLIFYEETVTYERLADQLCASTSIIYKDMTDLRKYENTYCRIVSDANGTRMQGTEYGIQRFLRDLCSDYMQQHYPDFSLDSLANIMANYFDSSMVWEIKENLDSFWDEFKRPVQVCYLNSFFIFLVIFAARKVQGKQVNMPAGLFEHENINISSESKSRLAREFKDRLAKELDVQFTAEEIKYIDYHLFVHKIETGMENENLKNLICYDVEDLINKVSKSVGIPLVRDEQLYDALVEHLIPLLFRTRSGIGIRNPVLREVKSNYPVLFTLIWLHSTEFAKRWDMVLSEDEVSFIVLHFQVALERNSPKGRILIVCESGLVTSELVARKIKKNLPSNVEIKMTSLEELNDGEMENADFIISTIDLHGITKSYIKVSPIVSSDELKAVYDHYLKYSASEVVRFNQSKHQGMKFIPQIICSNLIYIKDDLKSKEESMDFLIDSLYRSNYVEADFKQDILERELLGATHLNSGVSLPHVVSGNVNESVFAILLVPEGIFWGGSLVYLVLMMAMKEEDKEQIIEDLPLLYEKVLDNQFVESLREITDPNELQKRLLT